MKLWKINCGIALVTLLFGCNFVVSKYIFQWVSPLNVGTLRLFSGALFFLPFALKTWPRQISSRDLRILILSGAIGMGLGQLLFVIGLSHTTAGHSSIIVSAVPAITLIFGAIAGYERATFRKVAGFVLSFFGILYLMRVETISWKNEQFLGDFLTLLNAGTYSVYLVGVRPMSVKYSGQWVTWCVFAVGFGLFFPIGIQSILGTSWSTFPAAFWWSLFYIMVGGTVAAYWLITVLLRRAEPSHVAQGIYFQPIVAMMGGSVFLHEEISPRIIIATICVLCGVALAQLKSVTQRSDDLEGTA